MTTSPRSRVAGGAALHSGDNLVRCLPFSQKRTRNDALDGNDKLFHGGCRRKCKRKCGRALRKLAVEGDGHFDMREDKRTSSPKHSEHVPQCASLF